MKAGWQTVPLGEVCELSGGGTPPKNNSGFYGGSIPWATVRDMNVEQLTRTEHTITEAGLKASSSRVIPAGEVVIASRVGLGKVVILGQDTAINQDLRAVVPTNPDRLDRRFLFLWFKSIADQIVEAGTGATVQGVKLPFLKALPIPLPPLDEQKRIVAVLDETIEGLSRARANAEANLSDARELFESILRGVFHGVEQTAPKYTLAAVARTFGRGKSRHRPRNDPKLYGGNYPFVQTGDIRNSDGFVTAFSQTYNDLGLAQSKLWPEGTVCITIAANIAETAILGFPACFPDSIIGMVCDPEKARAEYIELMLRYFAADLKEQGKGSAQDNINLATFEQSLFPVPGITEQARIVEQLSKVAQERQSLEAHFFEVLNNLDTLRQSLLQKAFSGELT